MAMITERLQRRFAILRGKRSGAFDRDQYYLEHARRARVARKLRCYLRDMRPVVLLAPRWSEVRSFLDDVAVDVMLGHPSVRCRTLSVRPLEERTPHQAWNWLVHGVVEFCELPQAPAATQVVTRHGFRVVLSGLLRQSEARPRRCLMVHGLESLHVEVLQDLVGVFEDHIHHRRGSAAFNLVLAGPPALPHPELHGVERLMLDDYDDQEAIEALSEYLGPQDRPTLRRLVARVGGVPEMLARLSTVAAGEVAEIARDDARVWAALGGLGAEIRRTVDIVMSDAQLSTRLEQLAHDGPSAHDPERDPALVEAGLVRLQGPPMPRNEAAGVRVAPWARKRRALLRSPLVGRLLAR